MIIRYLNDILDLADANIQLLVQPPIKYEVSETFSKLHMREYNYNFRILWRYHDNILIG